MTPCLLAKAVNTLGQNFPDVEFVANVTSAPDISVSSLPVAQYPPKNSIRGYVFRLKTDGTGIAAIWTNDHAVEEGIDPNPIIRVKFGQPVQFIDLMGTARIASPNEDGSVTIPLSPAVLIVKAADPKKLAAALQLK